MDDDDDNDDNDDDYLHNVCMLSTITSIDGNGWLFYLVEKSKHFYPQYGNLLLYEDMLACCIK